MLGYFEKKIENIRINSKTFVKKLPKKLPKNVPERITTFIS